MRPELLGLFRLILPFSLMKITQPCIRQQPILWFWLDIINSFALIKLLRVHSLFYKTQAIDTNGYEIVKTNNTRQSITSLVNIFNLAAWGLKMSILHYTHNTQTVPTPSTLFGGLTWGEREISEMLGINYKNKLDARRLMLDYAFEGTPLRKNFPVMGFEEIEYNALERWIGYKNARIRDNLDL